LREPSILVATILVLPPSFATASVHVRPDDFLETSTSLGVDMTTSFTSPFDAPSKARFTITPLCCGTVGQVVGRSLVDSKMTINPIPGNPKFHTGSKIIVPHFKAGS